MFLSHFKGSPDLKVYMQETCVEFLGSAFQFWLPLCQAGHLVMSSDFTTDFYIAGIQQSKKAMWIMPKAHLMSRFMPVELVMTGESEKETQESLKSRPMCQDRASYYH